MYRENQIKYGGIGSAPKAPVFKRRSQSSTNLAKSKRDNLSIKDQENFKEWEKQLRESRIMEQGGDISKNRTFGLLDG